MHKHFAKAKSGFTLVELLIVIVIIAILAAITVVAYNGITQRATNTAIISSAGQAAKLIRLYKTANGAYPAPAAGTTCLTQDNMCTAFNGTAISASNDALLTKLQDVGTAPASVPKISSGYYGVYYGYNTNFTYNGAPDPVMVVFFLAGANQDCTNLVGGMVSVKDHSGVANDFIPATSSNGSLSSDGNGITRCYMMFP